MLANKLMSALSGGTEDKLYVDDVFSAYTYTGNGSTQTINNGIDLAGEGGLVWIKNRVIGANHSLIDTVRGFNKTLISNLTNSQFTRADSITSFDPSGFTLGTDASGNGTNYSTGKSIVSWTFRKAPKFFDVVTYTGNGASNRQISHALGIVPGMVIVKRTDGVGDWFVWHRGLSTQNSLYLNATNAQTSIGIDWSPSATTFTVTTQILSNTSGQTYVAYLFAHDPSADGIIQCGSCTASAVNLGWEPQYLLIKRSDSAGSWFIRDSARGMLASGNSQNLYADTIAAEAAGGSFNITATGFDCSGVGSGTYTYLAIRRPNKPPTSGTQVYNAIARTGTGAAATVTGVGFAPDLVMCQGRTPSAITSGASTGSRLQGISYLVTQATKAEIYAPSSSLSGWDMGGISIGGAAGDFNDVSVGTTYINHFFKRAPGFMDVVCYTGTGAARTVPHSLGVAPELMIVKQRSAASSWCVFNGVSGNGSVLNLENTSGTHGSNVWSYTSPTSSVLSVSGATTVNGSGSTYVAYLFASLPGISKVGSYTGNGTTQTINCGFTTGARFILIKRTDGTGDWYVWDSVRGIVAGNDSHLSLNTTATEVTTDDSVDPDVSGFNVNQVATTNINVLYGHYIFLAIS